MRGAAIVSGFTLLGKVLGFVQKQIMAYCFGTGTNADAFVLAFQSIGFAFTVIPQKAINTFLPLFLEKMTRAGEAAAWRFAWTVGLCLAVVVGFAVAGGMVAAPGIVDLTARFEDPATAALAARLVRIILPSAFVMALATLAFLILNSYKRFAFPAMGDVVSRVATFALVLGLYRAIGIRSFAWGIVAGSIACLLLQVGALASKIRQYRPSIDLRDPALRRLGLLILPVLPGAFLARLRTIVDNLFASTMAGGALSSLSYARTLPDTFTLLVPFAVGVSIYPFFSELHERRETAQLTDTLMSSLRLIAFLFVPLTVGLVLLRAEVVQLAFQRGEFGADAAGLTSRIMAIYTLGMPAYALEIILMQFYFALKDTWTPFLIGVAALGVHLAVVLLLSGPLGPVSLALAAAVSKTFKIAVLALLLRRKGLSLQAARNLVFTLKAGACALALAAAVWGALAAARRLPLPGGAEGLAGAAGLLVQLGVAAAAGGVAYLAAAALLRMNEVRRIAGWIRPLARRFHA